MTELNFQDAVQALRNNLGTQVETTETDGRDDMARVLKNQLGYSSAQADEMISALVDSGTVRYHRGETTAQPANELEVPVVPIAVAGASPSTTGTTGMGAAILPGALVSGYWQIGNDESGSTGRAGQVAPTL